MKRGLSSAKNWCSRHKKELIAVTAIAAATIITVLTAGLGSPALGSALSFGSWGVATSTLSFTGLISAPPLISGITIGSVAALAYYGVFQITKLPREPEPLKKPNAPVNLDNELPSHPYLSRKEIITPKVLKSATGGNSRKFKRRSAQESEIREKLKLAEQDELSDYLEQKDPDVDEISTEQSLARIKHDPKDTKLAKKQIKEYNMIEQTATIQDMQKSNKKWGDLWAGKKIFEIEVPRYYSSTGCRMTKHISLNNLWSC